MGHSISTAPPYSQQQAQNTFNDAIETGRSILGFDNPFILQDYDDYYNGTRNNDYTNKMLEERFKYSYWTDQDQRNYNAARRLIEETAKRILNAYHAAEASAAFAEGNLSGQWPPAVILAYTNVINKILNDYMFQASQIKARSDGTGCDGTLVWDVSPETPTLPEEFPASRPNYFYNPNSPIILDLDGDGVETVSAEEGVHFDHDGNRFAEKSGWVGSDDALLIRDLNGNGIIDGGGELFGNNTLLSSGKKAANGFEALAELDENGDGVVDKNDAAWGELKLWQDKDGDGVLDAGGMTILEKLAA